MGRNVHGDFNVDLSIKRLECVIATSKATEERAALLLELAKAPPEVLATARGIYVRAGSRLRRLQSSLDSMLAQEQETLGANEN